MATKPTTAPSAIICPPNKVIAMVTAIDKAYSHILKLQALLANTYGESGPTFRNMHDDLQDNYLWACTDLAEKIKADLDASFSVECAS